MEWDGIVFLPTTIAFNSIWNGERVSISLDKHGRREKQKKKSEIESIKTRKEQWISIDKGVFFFFLRSLHDENLLQNAEGATMVPVTH